MLSENGKINRLSGWKHTKTFQVYVYIAMNAVMCLLLFLFVLLVPLSARMKMWWINFSPLYQWIQSGKFSNAFWRVTLKLYFFFSICDEKGKVTWRRRRSEGSFPFATSCKTSENCKKFILIEKVPEFQEKMGEMFAE